MWSRTYVHLKLKYGPQSGGNSAPVEERRNRESSAPAMVAFGDCADLWPSFSLISGIWSRVKAGKSLRAETAQMALTSVSVVSPKQTAPAQEIILPGNVQPFISSPIYSRTDGYLKKWYFDIGAHVKQGQLLAVIETPEVDQQLQQARSNLQTAQANLELAEITKNRYQGLLKTHAVSQQDVDNAVGTLQREQSHRRSRPGERRAIHALVSFEKIYAPFDGVITARNTDIGDLINSGSNGGVKTDLFHIAQPGTLRVYVNVPEEYSQGIKAGMTGRPHLAEFPGREFPGKAGAHGRCDQRDNPHAADRN